MWEMNDLYVCQANDIVKVGMAVSFEYNDKRMDGTLAYRRSHKKGVHYYMTNVVDERPLPVLHSWIITCMAPGKIVGTYNDQPLYMVNYGDHKPLGRN